MYDKIMYYKPKSVTSYLNGSAIRSFIAKKGGVQVDCDSAEAAITVSVDT